MIQRHSSHHSSLKDFLATQLQGAHRDDRIADEGKAPVAL
jgi:hypothetical protein